MFGWDVIQGDEPWDVVALTHQDNIRCTRDGRRGGVATVVLHGAEIGVKLAAELIGPFALCDKLGRPLLSALLVQANPLADALDEVICAVELHSPIPLRRLFSCV